MSESKRGVQFVGSAASVKKLAVILYRERVRRSFHATTFRAVETSCPLVWISLWGGSLLDVAILRKLHTTQINTEVEAGALSSYYPL